MQNIYDDGSYAIKNPTWHEEDAPWKAKQIARILKKNHIDFNSLCEIGCGTGEILLELERVFPNTNQFGYEISPQAYERLCKKQTSRTNFFLSDLRLAKQAYFDVLLVIDVIEHVEDYISFVRDIQKQAKYKIFHIPLDLSAQSIVRSQPLQRLRRDVGHLHSFYRESALATLRHCGYTIVDDFYTASRLELPNQATLSNLMKIPRRICYALSPDITVRVLGGYSLLVIAQ